MLAEKAPQAMREALAPYVAEYCERLMGDVRDPECDGHRTAMAVYPRIMRAVGAGEELAEMLAALWRSYGLASEGEFRGTLEVGLQARNTDGDRAYQIALGYVHEYRRTHGMPELTESLAVVEQEGTDDK